MDIQKQEAIEDEPKMESPSKRAKVDPRVEHDSDSDQIDSSGQNESTWGEEQEDKHTVPESAANATKEF